MSAQFGGRQQLFLGVSTPLVWSATRPSDLAPAMSEAAATPSPVFQSGALEGQSQSLGEGVPAMESAAAAPPTPLDPYTAAAASGWLTDRDIARRAPCLMALPVYELELLILRCQRKAKLRTAVVCPGWLYGRGESDELLHPLMRAAWEVRSADGGARLSDGGCGDD
jgi:hypothetical protein